MRIRLAIVALATIAGLANAQSPFIDIPAYTRTFSAAFGTRGFQGQAPCNITVVGVEVPNEMNGTHQHVAVFNMSAKAPAFSASTMLTPVWANVGATSGAIMTVTPAVDIPIGNWIGVLGACSNGVGGTVPMLNSYGAAGPFAGGMVGGQATTLYRFLTQTNLSTLATNPNGPVVVSSEDAGNTTRVEVYVVACGADNAKPNPGASVKITCEAGLDAGLPYVLALSLGQAGIPIDQRTLDLSADGLFFATAQNLIPGVLVNAQGALDKDGLATAQLLIPSLPILVGTDVYAAFVTLNKLAPSGISSISKNFPMKIS